MKLHLPYLIFSIALLTIFNSCKKDDTQPAAIPQYAGFSAKINGVPYVANSVYCLLYVDSSMQFRSFVISGYHQSKILSMVFLDGVLTQVVDSSTSSGWFGLDIQYEDTLSSNYYTQINSNLEFSKFDTLNKITSGTFSGALVGFSPNDTLVVTDGVFSDVVYEWGHSN